LDVAVEAEARVLEPRLEDLGVAGGDDIRLAAVRDYGETRAAEREVALVRLHRRLDHAPRQREVALVEAALEHERLLDEVDHLLEHVAGVAPALKRVQPLDDRPPATRAVGIDTRREQRLRIRV